MQSDYISILRKERRKLLDTLRATRFSKLKQHITHSQIIPYASYSPWLDDEEFTNLYNPLARHTLVDVYRCFEL